MVLNNYIILHEYYMKYYNWKDLFILDLFICTSMEMSCLWIKILFLYIIL